MTFIYVLQIVRDMDAVAGAYDSFEELEQLIYEWMPPQERTTEDDASWGIHQRDATHWEVVCDLLGTVLIITKMEMNNKKSPFCYYPLLIFQAA
jgi:hypothetical protein